VGTGFPSGIATSQEFRAFPQMEMLDTSIWKQAGPKRNIFCARMGKTHARIAETGARIIESASRFSTMTGNLSVLRCIPLCRMDFRIGLLYLEREVK
jgi:hypothetical protein